MRNDKSIKIQILQSEESDFSNAYFYSSHYSSQAFVYNYLIRLEPFTKLHFDFMAQKFDCPQRLFYSIPNTWFSCQTNANDLRELTPEFFYLPEFLKQKKLLILIFKNQPYLQLGNLPNGKSINAVELPNWANNPEHFIEIHKKGLESPYVTKKLGKWIDLIFGEKQRSEEDFNIFPDCCYQDYIFKKIPQDTNQQIIQMSMSILVGQCPSQLFYSPHETKYIQIEEDIYRLPIMFQQSELEGPFKNKTITGFYQIGKNIYICDTQNQIYSIKTSELIKNFKNRSFKNKTISNEYEFKERGINTNYQMSNIVYSLNESIMIVGRISDSSFRIYKDLKEINKIHYHKKPINQIRVSEKHCLIFCASEDLRISVWDINKESGNINHNCYIYGHNQQITTISLSNSLKIIFSTDKDRICLIHTFKGKFLSNFVLRQTELNDYATLSTFSSDSSQILIATHQNSIQLYNINGELLLNIFSNTPSFNSIQQIDFFQKISLYKTLYYLIKQIVCTQNGQLKIMHDYHKYISNKSEKLNDQQIFKKIIVSNKDPITSFINLSDKSDYDILCITKKGVFKALKQKLENPE